MQLDTERQFELVFTLGLGGKCGGIWRMLVIEINTRSNVLCETAKCMTENPLCYV
jgi:hypothetical protein